MDTFCCAHSERCKSQLQVRQIWLLMLSLRGESSVLERQSGTLDNNRTIVGGSMQNEDEQIRSPSFRLSGWSPG